MADAVFFYMDRRCDPHELRKTGVIEPEKYAWMLTKRGINQNAVCLHRRSRLSRLLIIAHSQVSIMRENIQSYYDTGKVLYQLQEKDGIEFPVLDRKAWLKLQVFEAKANPQSAFEVRPSSTPSHSC